jgi:hypothetical protein
MPVQSLEPIKKTHDTGQRPVVVSCSDFQDYICKYPTNSPAQSLMTEWICAHAAQSSGLYIPPFDLVAVSPDHIPVDLAGRLLPGGRLDRPLFGSRHVGAVDMDKRTLIMLSKSKRKSKLENKDQLLRIALFDIWVANEDRHGNNYNLLLADVAGRLRFQVMDHGACFNTQAAFNHGLGPVTIEDSLISSELFAIVFKNPPNFVARIHAVCDELEHWQANALQHVEQWVVNAPDKWGIDRAAWLAFLRDRWLSDDWTGQTRQTFLEHTQVFINT